MDTTFKAGDETLQQLVTDRRNEVVRLQTTEVERNKDMDARAQTRIRTLRATLPKDTLDLIDKLGKLDDEASNAAKTITADARRKLADTAPAVRTAAHPGIVEGRLIAPHSVGWFQPYYGMLHGSDGSIVWQGYNPTNIDLYDFANGAGSGIFGSGAGSFTTYMDWWFAFNAPENRYYNYNIWVPFHGFYILYADDGFWDSKEAHARIDITAAGYQYNWKAQSTSNVFDMDSQNINVNDRFDGWRTTYYSDLLGADRAYLRVTAAFYVYARGGGSTAQLNFADGNANYIGIPWAYIV